MLRCQRCGYQNEPTSRFCVGCGSRLGSDAPLGAPGPSPVPNGPQPPHPVPVAAGRPSPVPAVGGYPAPSSHEPAPTRQRPIQADPLAFAETAPPLLDDDLRLRPHVERSRPSHNPPEHRRPSSPDPNLPFVLPDDAPRVLAGFLVSFDSSALGQSWSVHQGHNTVGRLGAGAGVGLELPHATVSSRHATIHAAAHPGRMVLEDHGSTNGTFVNDTALLPQQRRELRDGDRVRFGLFNLIAKII